MWRKSSIQQNKLDDIYYKFNNEDHQQSPPRSNSHHDQIPQVRQDRLETPIQQESRVQEESQVQQKCAPFLLNKCLNPVGRPRGAESATSFDKKKKRKKSSIALSSLATSVKRAKDILVKKKKQQQQPQLQRQLLQLLYLLKKQHLSQLPKAITLMLRLIQMI